MREEELQPQPLLQVREEIWRLQQQAREEVPRLKRQAREAPRQARHVSQLQRMALEAPRLQRRAAAACARGAVVAGA